MELEDYAGKHPNYAYYIESTVPLEAKRRALYEYLSRYKDDTNFQRSSSGGGPDDYEFWDYWIVSTLDKSQPQLLIQLTRESQSSNREEATALEEEWDRTLELICKLQARWDGSRFHVGGQRSFKCKEMVLNEFFVQYTGEKFTVETSYRHGSAMRVIAQGSSGSVALVIEYGPMAKGEVEKLKQLADWYTPDE